MQDKFCMHCFVAGQVQGVGYRVSTQKQAVQWGLTGWVRNLPDGRVEVLACGEKAQVLQLYAWLQQGPPKAKVAEVSYEELSWRDCEGFAIT